MVLAVFTAISTYIYDIIIAVIILFIGFGLGILVKRILEKVLKELELNKIMSRVNITTDLERWISSIVSYLIYLFTIVIFLDQLGIKSMVLYLAVGAVLMLLILTFLVGLKDVIPNFMGWLFIQRHDHLREGRKIDIKEISGIIENIGYLETEIKTEHGDILYVPNALFMSSKFKIKKHV